LDNSIANDACTTATILDLFQKPLLHLSSPLVIVIDGLLQGRSLVDAEVLYADQADPRHLEHFFLDFILDFKPHEVRAIEDIRIIPVCTAICVEGNPLSTSDKDLTRHSIPPVKLSVQFAMKIEHVFTQF
jgi:hypothetical protein